MTVHIIRSAILVIAVLLVGLLTLTYTAGVVMH